METTEITDFDLPQSLDERIAAIHADLSNKQKRLARFVLDNKYFISFAPAMQAAEKTGTSAATVVRFAQTLGYKGYSEMQAAIRAELPSYMTAVERIQKRLQAPSPPNDTAQKVFRTDINNIELTANNLSLEMVDQVVDAIVEADRIFIVGAGLSAAPAFLLAHSLKIIGLDARVSQNEGLFLAVDSTFIRSGDVVIAIGMWRYASSTINTVLKAKNVGACVITITDSIVSPLSKVADYAFEVVTDGVSYSFSTTAVVSLINVLIAALSYRIPEQTMESLRKVDSAYRDNDLLLLE